MIKNDRVQAVFGDSRAPWLPDMKEEAGKRGGLPFGSPPYLRNSSHWQTQGTSLGSQPPPLARPDHMVSILPCVRFQASSLDRHASSCFADHFE